MKQMSKRIISMLVIAILAIGLVACTGADEVTETPAPAPEATGEVATQPASNNDPDLEAFIKTQGDEFLSAFDKSFGESSGGMQCKSTLKVDGTKLVLDCSIQGINNVADAGKAQMQKVYEDNKEALKAGFAPLKSEVPTVSGIIINVCEEDGDILATINMDL